MNNTAAALPAINNAVTVGVSAEQAFHVFTESFHTWWPAGYHIGKVDPDRVIIEPQTGGRWYERGVDGSQCDWGHVVSWEPPHRLLLTWQINGEWQYDPDPAHASEIEVRFTPDGPHQTVVEMEHRHLDRLVGGQAMYEAVGGDNGWRSVLESYANAVANQASAGNQD